MRYVSTRGGGSPRPFREIVLSSLAPDGGLYVPETYPEIKFEKGISYLEVATAAMSPFAPGIDLAPVLKKAWKDFPPDPAPLKKFEENFYLLELFHGPSASFKDFGLQFLGALFEAFSEKPLTVIAATSGDTGAAAVNALKGKKGVRLFMLHPKGRISAMQRRQMTNVRAANIFNLAVEGSFDDCQRLLKQILARGGFTTVNSINWGRILAQSVYYHWAALGLLDLGPVHFVVPSGNFGNAFSGFVAFRSGARISGLTIATNANDILPRTFQTGIYKPGKTVSTISPAMDIQAAGNFERMLFEASGRDDKKVKAAVQGLAQQGFYQVPEKAFKKMSGFFLAASATEEDTRAAIKRAFVDHHEVLDPHTAVGLAVLKRLHKGPSGPKVLLATAHPAKFPETIPHAFLKSVPLPESLASLMEAPEVCHTVTADLGALESFIKEKIHDS